MSFRHCSMNGAPKVNHSSLRGACEQCEMIYTLIWVGDNEENLRKSLLIFVHFHSELCESFNGVVRRPDKLPNTAGNRCTGRHQAISRATVKWSHTVPSGGKPRAQEPQAPRYTIPTPSATLGNDGLGKRLKPSNDAEGSNKEDVRKSSTTSVALPSLTGGYKARMQAQVRSFTLNSR